MDYKKLYKEEFDSSLDYLRKYRDDPEHIRLTAENYHLFKNLKPVKNATGDKFHMKVAANAQVHALTVFKKECHAKVFTILGKPLRK